MITIPPKELLEYIEELRKAVACCCSQHRYDEIMEILRKMENQIKDE